MHARLRHEPRARPMRLEVPIGFVDGLPNPTEVWMAVETRRPLTLAGAPDGEQRHDDDRRNRSNRDHRDSESVSHDGTSFIFLTCNGAPPALHRGTDSHPHRPQRTGIVISEVQST